MFWSMFKKKTYILTREQVVEQILEYERAVKALYLAESDPVVSADLFGTLKGYKSALMLLQAEQTND